ncbi:hypothetical protein FIBSPDRAFT_952471 [Athelia psychrophila]|uniref:Uncharacterized protein n=1 Tax=Athelia psychrophila TaxID=1759441 RepID=A0A166LFE9_9AGAM|nr:hypothetical protein FIBSPDRAFT_952471 [Fibularhizoctonia sp. CBS 109695]
MNLRNAQNLATGVAGVERAHALVITPHRTRILCIKLAAAEPSSRSINGIPRFTGDLPASSRRTLNVQCAPDVEQARTIMIAPPCACTLCITLVAAEPLLPLYRQHNPLTWRPPRVSPSHIECHLTSPLHSKPRHTCTLFAALTAAVKPLLQLYWQHIPLPWGPSASPHHTLNVSLQCAAVAPALSPRP